MQPLGNSGEPCQERGAILLRLFALLVEYQEPEEHRDHGDHRLDNEELLQHDEFVGRGEASVQGSAELQNTSLFTLDPNRQESGPGRSRRVGVQVNEQEASSRPYLQEHPRYGGQRTNGTNLPRIQTERKTRADKS